MSIRQSHLARQSSKTSRKNFCIGSGIKAGATLSLTEGESREVNRLCITNKIMNQNHNINQIRKENKMKTILALLVAVIFYSLSLEVSSAQTYFSDDFESGKGKWIIGGNSWDTLSTTYTSSNHCITDSRTGNYAYNSDPTFTLSQSIDLANTFFPVLTFFHSYDLWAAACYQQPVVYDYIYLEISTNSGFNWSQIKVWSGKNKSWTHEQINLSNYKFNSVKFRFRLSSHNACSGVADGWYIDDVKVQEFISTNPTTIFPFCDGFESGKSNWLTGGFNWDTSSAYPNSGTFCVSDSRAGNYTHNSDPTIKMSSVLNLTNTNFPVLTFFHRYNLWAASCYQQPVVYDYIYLEISTNGGFNWSQLRSWQGTNVSWNFEQFDLSSYRTDKVKIRYYISSHNACGGNADGAYLDDVCFYDLSPNYINLNLKLLLQGMYDNVTNEMSMQDTFKVYLRNLNAPYQLRDSAKGVISPFSHSGQFYFKNAPSGTYHIVVKHRNSIDTWSRSGGVALVRGDGQVHTYDFTTDSNKAYGNNQIKKGSKWCIYNGDINQDGFIDGSDLGLTDNDAQLGAAGYLLTDVTGDYFVDGSDLQVVDNNSTGFIEIESP